MANIGNMTQMGWTPAAQLATQNLSGAAQSYASMDKAKNQTTTTEGTQTTSQSGGGSVMGDLMPILGTAVGAAAGTYFGNPVMGAQMGASLGGAAGSAMGGKSAAGLGFVLGSAAGTIGQTETYQNWMNNDSSSKTGEALASKYTTMQYDDPMYDVNKTRIMYGGGR